MQRSSLVLAILVLALMAVLPAAAPVVQAQADQGRIVFVTYHEAEGKSAISVINPDGSGLTRLTSFDTQGVFAYPVWSPDGSQIAFSIYQQFRADAWHSDIYVMQADGSNIRRLTTLNWAYQPVWSPDGQHIAFIYSESGNELASKLFTMRSHGSDIVEIPIFFQLNNERPNWIADLAWHPDGNRISFSSVDVREGEGVTYHYNYSAIYIVDKNGGAAQFVTAGSAPAWSPDGSRLAFIANTAGDVGFLFVMPADRSSEARLISEDDFFEAYEPTWSPDGSRLAYYGMGLEGHGIFIINADGSGRFKLVDDSRSPNWSRPASGQPVPPPAGDERCFAETGFCIAGRIRSYWEQNGGLPVFGFPLTEQREEVIEGRAIQVQWFERNRLELHPANPQPYDVLLGRLGADRLAQRGYDWQAVPVETSQAGCRFFAETGRNVCGEILAAWRANGLELDGRPGFSESENLALFGLPLTGLISEQLSDGHEYQVQYFERARFELHPENAPPYNVLLGLLGQEVRAGR
ncbi:PD40 domain-containing protein [Candidatus Viridilinea mediisalina]|uniref:Peptidase S9 n=1 Tax=Candidatus Viridilinea mediisalina TaxID=2024553 RepID=A0A2A6RI30_9CHLR|nr:PD40 domain-containing protein [Candidatus Viridilinea mediisalina]PDW02528.1 hypothetical protein CJ255_13500 [Candidatus Viridilinea mediisalina]